MKCGRGPGGGKTAGSEICPAAVDTTFDGFNRGTNAGRSCWLVAGTFCNEVVMGTFAKKRESCKECDFYEQVHAETGTTDVEIASIDISAFTHIGRVRKTNEDRYFIEKLADGAILLAVADGLGGEVAGDYAAEIMMGKLAGIHQIEKGHEQEQLSLLAMEADLAVTDKKEKDPDLEGMGTTLVCVLLRGRTAYWVHVGDSRLYFLRNNTLTQLTEDQTLARFLLAEGEITPEEVPTHYSRHVMDQCIGCGYCEPETGRLNLKNHDLLILTSDGLHKEMTAEKMASILNRRTDIKTKACNLVEAALKTGGNDNITIVIAKNTANEKGALMRKSKLCGQVPVNGLRSAKA
ncbi:MAG: serine/threonine-protein phosphatase [Deltaproteobacteria bacterium]|nr:serine/threonine-protein phosphatase [Deltaproteobacteria bacterium]